MNVAVIGGGALGSVMVGLLKENEFTPSVYDSKQTDVITSTSLEEVVSDADVVFLCIPSFAIKDSVIEMNSYLKEGSLLINCAKGFEEESLAFLTDVISENVSGGVLVGELSGPAIAKEISDKRYTKVDIVVPEGDSFEKVCTCLNTDYFRCVRVFDSHAVELGGIMKNVYALLCGIIDGVHGATNTKAIVLTEGMYEMARLGFALGVQVENLYGLAGLGDLLTTCMSENSRNRRFGMALADGKSVQEAMDDLGMVAEGYYATKTVYRLAERENVELPLLKAVYDFLYGELSLDDLMKQIISDSVIQVK